MTSRGRCGPSHPAVQRSRTAASRAGSERDRARTGHTPMQAMQPSQRAVSVR